MVQGQGCLAGIQPGRDLVQPLEHLIPLCLQALQPRRVVALQNSEWSVAHVITQQNGEWAVAHGKTLQKGEWSVAHVIALHDGEWSVAHAMTLQNSEWSVALVITVQKGEWSVAHVVTLQNGEWLVAHCQLYLPGDLGHSNYDMQALCRSDPSHPDTMHGCMASAN